MATVPAWKMELNERLAATRMRRLRNEPEQAALPGLEDLGEKGESRASRLAARVAERYANAPSYSEVLAAQERARKAAAIERRTNEAVASASASAPPTVAAFPDWQVPSNNERDSAPSDQQEIHLDAHEELEEERVIEPLTVNLIEFPRELVAARKMRPRLAEGPLQLEAAEETISQGVTIGPAPANWSPILLDEDVAAQDAAAVPQKPLQIASLEDRVMAAIFDLALVVAAFALFVLVFVACTTHPPTGRPAIIAAALALSGFSLLYHLLFFRYAEGTPGMRYAKIALCTFEDDNPTRPAMCRRVLLLVLSAAPLGLGFLWACIDQDHLGWHDRISRMYQRSYS